MGLFLESFSKGVNCARIIRDQKGRTKTVRLCKLATNNIFSLIYQSLVSHVSLIHHSFISHSSLIHHSLITHSSLIHHSFISHLSLVYDSHCSPIIWSQHQLAPCLLGQSLHIDEAHDDALALELTLGKDQMEKIFYCRQ